MNDIEKLRERSHIGGFLAEWLSLKIIEHYGPIPVGGADFKALDLEESRELGYDDDDPVILIRRESDGVVFEVEIEPVVRRVPTEAEAAEGAGQLSLPGVPA